MQILSFFNKIHFNKNSNNSIKNDYVWNQANYYNENKSDNLSIVLSKSNIHRIRFKNISLNWQGNILLASDFSQYYIKKINFRDT